MGAWRHAGAVQFSDQLRRRSPDELRTLLRLRPDLLDAVDGGWGALARRASSPISLSRTLVDADIGMLVVLEALVVAGRSTVAELDELLGTDDPIGVTDAIERLVARALVTVDAGIVRLAPAVGPMVTSALGLPMSVIDLWSELPVPTRAALIERAGLDATDELPPRLVARAVAARLRRTNIVPVLRAEGPGGIAELLDRILDGRGAVHVPSALDDGLGPALEWLVVEVGAVTSDDAEVIGVPRDVVMGALGPLAPGAALRPPGLVPLTGPPADGVQGSSAQAAGRLLDLMDSVVRAATDGTLSVRRDGAIGIREVRRLAKAFASDEREIGFVLELALTARLLVRLDQIVAPTDLAGTWATLPRWRRWEVLVRTWLDQQQINPLIGEKIDGRTVGVFDHLDLVTVGAPARRHLLATIDRVAVGEVLDPEALAAAAVWRQPNRWRLPVARPEAWVGWTVEEASRFGLVVEVGPTAVLGAVLSAASGAEDELHDAARALLGEDGEHVVLQSDLTATALGAVTPELTATLDLVADRERVDGAARWRFSEATLRRALDRGWTVEELRDALDRVSLTGRPQPLDYLIDDVARRHGRIRVLPASAVIVTEDDVTAITLAGLRRADRIGLRLIAPTVLTTTAAPEDVLDELRAAGHMPTMDGDVLRLTTTAPTVETFHGQDLPADWLGAGLDPGVHDDELAEAVLQLAADDPGPASVDEIGAALGRGVGRQVRLRLAGERIVRGVLLAVDPVAVLDEGGVELVDLARVAEVELG